MSTKGLKVDDIVLFNYGNITIEAKVIDILSTQQVVIRLLSDIDNIFNTKNNIAVNRRLIKMIPKRLPYILEGLSEHTMLELVNLLYDSIYDAIKELSAQNIIDTAELIKVNEHPHIKLTNGHISTSDVDLYEVVYTKECSDTIKVKLDLNLILNIDVVMIMQKYEIPSTLWANLFNYSNTAIDMFFSEHINKFIDNIIINDRYLVNLSSIKIEADESYNFSIKSIFTIIDEKSYRPGESEYEKIKQTTKIGREGEL